LVVEGITVQGTPGKNLVQLRIRFYYL